MKKLKLDLDALTVESFAPSKAPAEAGTVRGYLTAYYELCYPDQTWEDSCTCEPTCNADTCYTCYNCGGTAGCATGGSDPACTSTCAPTPVTGCPIC
jgi:hypothetical protein